MKTNAEVVEILKRIIVEEIGLAEDMEKVKPETTFLNDLGADSLDLVEIAMALEEELEVEIPDEEWNSLPANYTVQNVADMVCSKMVPE